MALPVIKTLHDCADFSKTVAPYIPQLSILPQQIFESISNPNALKQIYLDTNPLITAFAFTLFISPIFLLVSEVNRNYSQVDRCWSILPTIFNAHYAIYAHMVGLPTERLDTLLMVSAIWSARLSYNYFRKGGYSIGSEDYRWEALRTYINPLVFFLFNVFFISLAQSVLLFLITTPTYILLLNSRIINADSDTLNLSDTIFSRVMPGFVLVAFFADQQQWRFQSAKAQYKATAKPTGGYTAEELDRGFVVSGLWSWSRHPNFTAEQAFWVTLYQWACFTTDTFVNWTGIGAAGYLILFQASTWFTEKISARKYSDYKEYQARVGKFLPKLSTDAAGWDDHGADKASGGNGGRRVTRSAAKEN